MSCSYTCISAMLLKFALLAVGLVFALVFASCLYIVCQILLVRWKFRHLPTPRMKRNKTYGSIFVVFAVHRASVICIEPLIVKELLVSTNSEKPSQLYSVVHSVFGQRFMGTGLISVLDNEVWASHRKIFNPAFKRGFLIDLLYQYNESAEQLISNLSYKADGETEIPMYEELNKLSLDVIAKVAFGLRDLNALSDKRSMLCEAAANAFHGSMLQMQLSVLASLNQFAIGRDERFWDDPEEFDPERFRKQSSRLRQRLPSPKCFKGSTLSLFLGWNFNALLNLR